MIGGITCVNKITYNFNVAEVIKRGALDAIRGENFVQMCLDYRLWSVAWTS